jgi:hypothetical protein
MFIIDPGGPLEARLDVNAARAFDLQMGVRPAGGAPRLLGRWSGAAPVTAGIPPLDDGDRLLVALHLLGEEADGLVDVNFALSQGGAVLAGSEHTLRKPLRLRLVGVYLDYALRADRLKLVRGDAVVFLDEERWRGEAAANLAMPELVTLHPQNPDRWIKAVRSQFEAWSRATRDDTAPSV